MAIVSSPGPTPGGPRGTNEGVIRTLVNALKADYNGNVDDTNVKTGANINGSKIANATIAAAHLATGAKRLFPQFVFAKIGTDHYENWGSGATTWGGTTCTVTITHGLGAVPTYANVVAVEGGAVFFDSMPVGIGLADATTFTWKWQSRAGATLSGSMGYWWIARS